MQRDDQAPARTRPPSEVRARRPADAGFFKSDAVAWRIALALLTSVMIPLVMDLLSSGMPLWGQVVVACGSFTSFASAELVVSTAHLRRRQAHDEELWDTHHSLDAALQSMRKSLRIIETIEPSEDALFRNHFRRRVDDLELELRTSAESRSLEVKSYHLRRAHLVLNDYIGRKGDIILAVQMLEDRYSYADHFVQEWFQRVYDLMGEGRVVGVRRLFLFTDPAVLDDPMTRLLVDFHTSNPGYDCRIVPAHTFHRSVEDYGVHLDHDDFAIYSDRYAFFGRPADSRQRTGVWTKDPDALRRFRLLFDSCWDNPATTVPRPKAGRRPVTPTELFTFALQAVEESDHGS